MGQSVVISGLKPAEWLGWTNWFSAYRHNGQTNDMLTAVENILWSGCVMQWTMCGQLIIK